MLNSLPMEKHPIQPNHVETVTAEILPEEVREEVAAVASQVYEVREGREGNPEEDWLKAEAILQRREREAQTEQPLVDHSKSAELKLVDGTNPSAKASTT